MQSRASFWGAVGGNNALAAAHEDCHLNRWKVLSGQFPNRFKDNRAGSTEKLSNGEHVARSTTWAALGAECKLCSELHLFCVCIFFLKRMLPVLYIVVSSVKSVL